MDVLTRILKSTERTGACLLWTGCTVGGYGMISIRNRTRRVHRVMYELVHGPIPSDDEVCHTCDVPNCVEPDHLALGTHAENMFDRLRKGRFPRGEKHHVAVLTEQTVLEIRASKKNSFELSKELGISHNTIRNIRNRNTWRHI